MLERNFNIEDEYLDLLHEMVHGDWSDIQSRDTRSGKTLSVFDVELKHNSEDNFPLFTSKKVNFNAIVGELMWFLSGKTDLPSLRHFSDIKEGGWTIWTQDYEDYLERLRLFPCDVNFEYCRDNESLGLLYGNQWRHFGNRRMTPSTHMGTDQISNLIKGLKEDPHGRRHIVTSYDPTLTDLEYALPPCHISFQCYIEYDALHLRYDMRSNDLFLGAPFNLASYALLQAILAKLTGYEVGNLTASLGDAHVYESHTEAVQTQLDRKTKDFPTLILPEFSTLDELVSGEITAKDFKLEGYDPHPPIKAPLETAKVSV